MESLSSIEKSSLGFKGTRNSVCGGNGVLIRDNIEDASHSPTRHSSRSRTSAAEFFVHLTAGGRVNGAHVRTVGTGGSPTRSAAASPVKHIEEYELH